MWRAAKQREGSVTVLPSTSRWGGLVSDPGPPCSSNSQSPHRDDASSAETSHKAHYIFSFILVFSVITLWNKAEIQPIHWCQPSSIRRRQCLDNGCGLYGHLKESWTNSPFPASLVHGALSSCQQNKQNDPLKTMMEMLLSPTGQRGAHTHTFFFWTGTGSPLLWPWGSQTRPPSTPPCRIRMSVMNPSTAHLFCSVMFTALPCPLIASLPALGSFWFFIHDVTPKL